MSEAPLSRLEEVARIIDPDEWLAVDRRRLTMKGRIVTLTDAVKQRHCKRSLSKAAAIEALYAVEIERVRAVSRSQSSGRRADALSAGLDAEPAAGFKLPREGMETLRAIAADDGEPTPALRAMMAGASPRDTDSHPGHACEACGGTGLKPDHETGSYRKGREPW